MTRSLAVLSNGPRIPEDYGKILKPKGYDIVQSATDMTKALLLAGELSKLGVPVALVVMDEVDLDDPLGLKVCNTIRQSSDGTVIIHKFFESPSPFANYSLGVADRWSIFYEILNTAFEKIEGRSL